MMARQIRLRADNLAMARLASLGIATLMAFVAVTTVPSRCEAIDILDGNQVTLSGTYGSVKVSGFAWGPPANPFAVTRSRLTVNDPLTLTGIGTRESPTALVMNFGEIVMNASITGDWTTISPVGNGPDSYRVDFVMNGGTLATHLEWMGGTYFTRSGGTLALTGFYTWGADHVLEWKPGDTMSGKAEFGYSSTLQLLSDFRAPRLDLYSGAAIDRDTKRYQVDELYVNGGGVPTSATFKPGDDIGVLHLSNYGTLTTETSLDLSAIDVRHFDNEGPGLLAMGAFTSHTSGTDGSNLVWGLRVAGDNRVTLTTYLAQGLVTATNNAQPVSVIYAPELYGNYTFIGYASVPEIDPSGLASVVSLLVGALGLVERRSRARAHTVA